MAKQPQVCVSFAATIASDTQQAIIVWLLGHNLFWILHMFCMFESKSIRTWYVKHFFFTFVLPRLIVITDDHECVNNLCSQVIIDNLKVVSQSLLDNWQAFSLLNSILNLFHCKNIFLFPVKQFPSCHFSNKLCEHIN